MNQAREEEVEEWAVEGPEASQAAFTQSPRYLVDTQDNRWQDHFKAQEMNLSLRQGARTPSGKLHN